MSRERLFGEIPGIPVGAVFESRADLAAAGVHRPLQAGISGSQAEGADSIVLNGGYEDDRDLGDEVIYTGHGGNDPSTGKQVGEQYLRFGNLALAKSCVEGLPVRVVRGSQEPFGFGPPAGYRYDGLYRVESYWSEIGRSGFRIWRFRLVRDDSSPAPWHRDTELSSAEPAPRRPTTIQRLVRNTAAAQLVKEIHHYRCQVCGLRLETPAGPYAEGAHIRPLGRPHNGPDVIENLLCLCPNHHLLFDTGGIIITGELDVIETVTGSHVGHLQILPLHPINPDHLAYHRQLYQGGES